MKKIVRSPHSAPTPYLKSLSGLFGKIINNRGCIWGHKEVIKVVDLGCGNGRNSKYLESLFFNVLSFDKQDDYGYLLYLEKQSIPIFGGEVNIFLLQYVLMFIHPDYLKKKVIDIFLFMPL